MQPTLFLPSPSLSLTLCATTGEKLKKNIAYILGPSAQLIAVARELCAVIKDKVIYIYMIYI